MSEIKIRTKRFEQETLVRLLITHPMETGRRIDPDSGQPIPAHFIEKLTVFHNDSPLVSCRFGPGISADPYFAFRFKHGKGGDDIKVIWHDNTGNSAAQSVKLR